MFEVGEGLHLSSSIPSTHADMFWVFCLVMLGQRYTTEYHWSSTPMVTVVCPVTNLHHMASLQSASSCNCTSYAGIVSLMYSNTPPPLLPILSFLNIT